MKKPLLFLRHLQSLLVRQSQQMGNNGERLKAWCRQTALQSACEWCANQSEAGTGAGRGMEKRKRGRADASPKPQTLLS